MTEITFDHLKDVELRTAWEHEAHDFTPWLARNIDRLSDAIGIELELLEVEATLPTTDDAFSADILARNVRDDSNVIIENQLDKSDHKHLGQLLTYLAGREAKTVIWIAKDFREAHLAAIRWLNQHTTEEHSFIAIRLRVVRIGNSALAPLFDILEKPNTWEKRLQSSSRAAKETNPMNLHRRAYWKYFFETYPEHANDGIGGASSTVWHQIRAKELVLSYYISKDGAGLFVRGEAQVPLETVLERLHPYSEHLKAEFGAPIQSGSPNGCFLSRMNGDFTDPEQIAELAAWMDAKLKKYTQELIKIEP